MSCINSARAANGVRPLSVSGDLSSVAQSWSARMAAAGTISHNPNLTSQVTNWQIVGENVGMGPTTSALCTAFMNSPEHRDNILDPSYTQVGVGTVVSNGTIFVTEDFRKPAGSAAPAVVSAPPPAPAAPQPAPAPASAAPVAQTQPRPAGDQADAAPAAPAAAPAATPVAPAPVPPASAPAPVAPPVPTLAERLATAQAAPAAADPLTRAMGYVHVMDALAG
ncbi:MAG: hypothetical protein NVSMB13_11430 [Mycobacteriales bacterium]